MYRLMIADDQSIECRALEHKIQTEFENIEVLPSARDGIDFLKKAEEFKPDIAIVDINMPGLNGLETIEDPEDEKYKYEGYHTYLIQ